MSLLTLTINSTRLHADELNKELSFDDNPFKIMQHFHESMMKEMNSNDFFKNFERRKMVADFKQKEDKDFIFYEIELEKQPGEVKVNVKDGTITIFIKEENKINSKDKQEYYASSIMKAFPVPSNTDAEKFKLDQQDKRLIIKFPKKKLV